MIGYIFKKSQSMRKKYKRADWLLFILILSINIFILNNLLSYKKPLLFLY